MRTETGELFRLGLPIMVGQLGIIILSIADTMMVGRFGTDELAAASFVNNMFNLVIIFSTGFSYGLTPLVGGMFGRNDFHGAGRILRNSLAVNASVAFLLIIMMTVLYLFIGHLGQPAHLLPLMKPYFLILLASLLPVMLFNSFKQFFDGITDTVTPMFVLIGGNLLNIVGNWLLIYGKLGFPRMGLMGAGVATLVSRCLMLVCVAIIFCVSKRYAGYRSGFRMAGDDRKDMTDLCRMGFPVGLQMGMETASFSLTTIMVGWLGATALAAHQVMLTVGQLGFMMYYGMAAALAVRASNFKGRSDMDGVARTVSTGFGIILCMAASITFIMLIFRNDIGYLFTEDDAVASMVAMLVIPFALYQFGDGLQCTYSNALRGISDVKMVTWYAFIAYFVVSIPSGYVFAFVLNLGLVGIWLSFPLGLTCAGFLFWRRFRKCRVTMHKE
ncbi:MAG: MATE family efflux transporter [Candidatus Cryptobacteroides sp.]